MWRDIFACGVGIGVAAGVDLMHGEKIGVALIRTAVAMMCVSGGLSLLSLIPHVPQCLAPAQPRRFFGWASVCASSIGVLGIVLYH